MIECLLAQLYTFSLLFIYLRSVMADWILGIQSICVAFFIIIWCNVILFVLILIFDRPSFISSLYR